MAQRVFHKVSIDLAVFVYIEESKERCREALNTLIKLLRNLKCYIDWSKVEGSIERLQHLKFFGIEVESVTIQIRRTNIYI